MITLTSDELDALMHHTAAISRAVHAIEDAVTDTEQGAHYPTVCLSLVAITAVLMAACGRAGIEPAEFFLESS